MFPERFSTLPEYAFPRLRALLDVHEAGGEPVHMTIGEPKHAFPAWVTDVIAKHAEGFGRYPVNEGIPELRAEIAAWIARRWSDPAFPSAFPTFNTVKYWSEHILTLREQMAMMDEPALTYLY